MEGKGKKALLSVQNLLLKEMREGVYRYADMLPPESILAERLSISRTQLRDSLAQLEREGFITRRHGVGTVINRHVLSVPVRADIELEYMEMIQNCGCRARERFLRAERLSCNEEIAKRLNIAPGDQVLMVARIALADDKPVIYCEDYLPTRLIRRESYQESSLQKPIFEFLREHCDIEVYMDLTDIHPTLADAALAEVLQVEQGAPLLYMDERDFDINGMTVLYARQYYIDGVITHTLMRKKF